MTDPAHEGLVEAYLDAIVRCEDGDVVDINRDQWAVAEHLRVALGEKIPDEVCRLIGKNGRNAWLWEGIYLLFGDGANRRLACDIVNTALILFEADHPEDLRPRNLVRSVRSETFNGNSLVTQDDPPDWLFELIDSNVNSRNSDVLSSIANLFHEYGSDVALFVAVGAENAWCIRTHEVQPVREAHHALVARYLRAGGAP